MKANRKFVQEDDAVSPVIAVILMVAITVVLAATVFVLLQGIGGPGKSAAAIGWENDETNDRLTVKTAGETADWNKLTVQVDSCGGTGSPVMRVGDATATDGVVNENSVAGGQAISGTAGTNVCGSAVAVRIEPNANTKILVNDYLDFCVTGTTGGVAATNVKVTIIDTNANAEQHTFTFNSIAAC